MQPWYDATMADGIKAMTVRLPEDLYERLRQAAFQRREAMSVIILRATERELCALEDAQPGQVPCG